MTINLFVIANVKQLRTAGSFRILLPFFLTSWGVGVLNSAIFNSFHNRVEFGTNLEGLRYATATDSHPSSTTPSDICTHLFRGKMHSDWFHGVEIVEGRWQHGEEVGYWFPSTIWKWGMYVARTAVAQWLRCCATNP